MRLCELVHSPGTSVLLTLARPPQGWRPPSSGSASPAWLVNIMTAVSQIFGHGTPPDCDVGDGGVNCPQNRFSLWLLFLIFDKLSPFESVHCA